MPIANYSTTSTVRASLDKIMTMLAKAGARTISQDFGPGGTASGLTFDIQTEHGMMSIRLPVRTAGVQATLKRDGVPPRYSTPEHAARVAWKVAHDWLRAQLALIDAGMVSLPEVMLPYALIGPERTVYEQYVESRGAIER